MARRTLRHPLQHPLSAGQREPARIRGSIYLAAAAVVEPDVGAVLDASRGLAPDALAVGELFDDVDGEEIHDRATYRSRSGESRIDKKRCCILLQDAASRAMSILVRPGLARLPERPFGGRMEREMAAILNTDKTFAPFRARRAHPNMPGDTVLKLTADWAGLAKGTLVQPSSFGYDRYAGRHMSCRRVVVVSGPLSGQRHIGPSA